MPKKRKTNLSPRSNKARRVRIARSRKSLLLAELRRLEQGIEIHEEAKMERDPLALDMVDLNPAVQMESALEGIEIHEEAKMERDPLALDTVDLNPAVQMESALEDIDSYEETKIEIKPIALHTVDIKPDLNIEDIEISEETKVESEPLALNTVYIKAELNTETEFEDTEIPEETKLESDTVGIKPELNADSALEDRESYEETKTENGLLTVETVDRLKFKLRHKLIEVQDIKPEMNMEAALEVPSRSGTKTKMDYCNKKEEFYTFRRQPNFSETFTSKDLKTGFYKRELKKDDISLAFNFPKSTAASTQPKRRRKIERPQTSPNSRDPELTVTTSGRPKKINNHSTSTGHTVGELKNLKPIPTFSQTKMKLQRKIKVLQQRLKRRDKKIKDMKDIINLLKKNINTPDKKWINAPQET